MNWIRISVNMPDDPALTKIGARLRRDEASTLGLLVALFCALPQHARDGNVSATPDAALERWARWNGKRGVFASAFRAELCDEHGVIKAWEKYNGAALREADRKREATAKWRAARSGYGSDHRSGDVTVRNPPTGRDVTGRDGTTPTPTAVSSHDVAKPPRRRVTRNDAVTVPRADGWEPNFGAQLHEHLLARKQLLVDPARLARAFRLARRFPFAAVARAIEDSVAHAKSRGAEWAPEPVARDLPRIMALSHDAPVGADSERTKYVLGQGVA